MESGDSGGYVRNEAVERNRWGCRTGVFGLIDTPAEEERLPAEEEAARHAGNAWYGAADTDPSAVDPAVCERGANPGAAAWSKASAAAHLIERVPVAVPFPPPQFSD